MSDIKMEDFTNSQKRQMPVILILDVSGSMSMNGRIHQLNRGVKGMLMEFARFRSQVVEYCVSMITFGGDEAEIIIDNKMLREIKWKDLDPKGRTPLADALDKAKAIIEDRSKITKNSYRPTVILLTDGVPTDDDIVWKTSMKKFTDEGRTSKCDRFAVSVEGAALETLEMFVKDPKTHLFTTENAEEITEFMRFMTASLSHSASSTDPNKKAPIDDIKKAVNEQPRDDDFGDGDVDFLLNGIID